MCVSILIVCPYNMIYLILVFKSLFSSMKYTLNDSEKEYLGSGLVPSLCQCLGKHICMLYVYTHAVYEPVSKL